MMFLATERWGFALGVARATLGAMRRRAMRGARRLRRKTSCLWTNRDHEKVFVPEYIGHKSEPGELKHLSTRRKGHQRDSVSSGERTRTRPVLLFF